MPTDTDDLDKLLRDVRKSIHANQLFIRTILDDTVESNGRLDSEDDSDQETFEEL